MDNAFNFNGENFDFDLDYLNTDTWRTNALDNLDINDLQPPAMPKVVRRLIQEDDDFLDPEMPDAVEGTDQDLMEDDLPGQLIEGTSGKFRFQGNAALLTYKGHLPKDKLEAWFMDVNGFRCMEVRIAHEIGKSNGIDYPHTHVVWKRIERLCRRGADCFDWKNDDGSTVHPHIRRLSGPKAWADALHYIRKEDKDVAGSSKVDAETLWDKIQMCESLDDVLHMAKTPGEIIGLKSAWETLCQVRAQNIDASAKPLKQQWQRELGEELLLDADARKVIWYWDVTGGSGKTEFCRQFEASNPDCFVLTDFGGQRGVACIFQKHLEAGGKLRVILVDLPRQFEDRDIYGPIEIIKNGMLTNTKYAGSRVRLDGNMVICVFANFLPKVAKMSLDRWDIRKLKKMTGGDWSVSKLDAYSLAIAQKGEKEAAEKVKSKLVFNRHTQTWEEGDH